MLHPTALLSTRRCHFNFPAWKMRRHAASRQNSCSCMLSPSLMRLKETDGELRDSLRKDRLVCNADAAPSPTRCSGYSTGFHWGGGSHTRWHWQPTRCVPQQRRRTSATWYTLVSCAGTGTVVIRRSTGRPSNQHCPGTTCFQCRVSLHLELSTRWSWLGHSIAAFKQYLKTCMYLFINWSLHTATAAHLRSKMLLSLLLLLKGMKSWAIAACCKHATRWYPYNSLALREKTFI